VRVDGVYDLAAWLLEGSPGSPSAHWDAAMLRQIANKGQTEKIRLLHPVPVVWAYMTGWPSADGAVHFRRDIYGLDKQTAIRPVGRAWARREQNPGRDTCAKPEQSDR
jgi:L,D-transpeptidase YcbB